MKKYLLLAAIALGGGVTALVGAKFMGWGAGNMQFSDNQQQVPVHFAHYTPNGTGASVADFTFAAEKSLAVVVHIKSSVRMRRPANVFQGFGVPEPFRRFFEDPRGQLQPGGDDDTPDDMQQGSGSGVILSTDGYIVTNNHVVKDAEELTVTLNDKREFKAEVIGTDPSTDLALVKIDAADLPFAQFANSDNIKVGEWVVAIGNPFNLASTVTAGIVSAKGRDIHIVQDKAPIESFIQTDAVVNPGNSGGALLNLNGELIGINTAIASPTGVYAGYAFAIPSNLVAKVVDDISKFGVVQRGYLGLIIRDQTKNKSEKSFTGVKVDSLAENSAAGDAGVKRGDIITKIDGQAINSSPELLEMVGKHRPGDRLKLTVLRNGDEKEFDVTLKNRSGNTDIVKKPEGKAGISALGAEFEALSRKEADKLGIDGGVRLKTLNSGKLSNETDIREGFVITKINNDPVRNTDDLESRLQRVNGGVMIEGIYPDYPNRKIYYAFGM